MARYIFQGTFRDGQGNIIPSGTVTVYDAGTTTLSTIYTADSGGTAVTSVISDSNGFFYFYIDSSDYGYNAKFDIVLSKDSYTSKTYKDIIIYGPVDSMALNAPTISEGTINGGTISGVTLTGTITATDANFVDLTLIKYLSNYSDFATAVSSIGSTPTTLIIDTVDEVSADTTIPSTLHMVCTKQGGLNVATGKTLTISGPFEAGDYQVFGGSGTVSGLSMIKASWFGATGDGATDDTDAINTAISSLTEKGVLSFKENATYVITDTVAFNKLMGIQFNNCTFSYDGHGTALQIGADAAPRFYGGWSDGYVKVMRTESITADGTQSAASQLLGTGIKFQYVQNYMFRGMAYVYGFAQGYYFGNHATILELHNLQSQNCLVDFYYCPDDVVGGFTTAIDLYSPFNSFNPANWSDITGAHGVEMDKNGRACDGHNVWGGALEAAKDKKVKSGGTECSFLNVYWDTPTASRGGGTYDFEFTSDSARNIISGGATMVGQVVTDSGSKNSVVRQRDFWVDGNSVFHFGAINTDLAFRTYQSDAFIDESYIPIPTTTSGWLQATFTKGSSAVGDATTTWNVSNPAGSTFRYTYSGAGTDPSLTSAMQRGTVTISGGTLAAGNLGTFNITGAGANYFEISNGSGVVEAGKTGTVTQHIVEHGIWVWANDNASTALVTGTTNAVVGWATDAKLSFGASGGAMRLTNRMMNTAGGELRLIYYYN